MQVRFRLHGVSHRIHHGPLALLGTVFARRRWQRLLFAWWLLSDVHDRNRWLPELIRERR